MTQTTTVVQSYDVTPTTPAGQITRITDDSILVKVWSTPIACNDSASFTATPAADGTITVQFSADGVSYTNAAGAPYANVFSGGVPSTALWIRATATGGTGTLVLDTPVAWAELDTSEVVAVGQIISGSLTDCVYNGSGRLESYSASGIAHTITWVGDVGTIANATGATSRVVTLNASGQVVSFV